MPTNNPSVQRLRNLAASRVSESNRRPARLPSLSDWQAQLEKDKAAAKANTGHSLADYGNRLAAGAAGVGGAAIELADLATGGAINRASERSLGRRATDIASDASQHWIDKLSPAAQESRSKRFISDKEGEIFGDAWSDPHAVLGTIVESSPSLAVSAGVAGLGAKAGAAAATRSTAKKLAGRKVSEEAGKRLAGRAARKGAVRGATIGGGAAEGSIEAGFAASELDQALREVEAQEWLKSPRFQQYTASGMSAEDAKEAVIRDAKRMAAMKVGTISSITGAVFGKYLGDLIAKKGAGRAVEGAKGLLVEGGTEFIQEGSQGHTVEQTLVDEFDRKYRWRDVLNQAVAGAVAGGVQGGAIGLAAGGQRGPISRAGQQATGPLPPPPSQRPRTPAAGEAPAAQAQPVDLSEERRQRLDAFTAAINNDDQFTDEQRKAAVEHVSRKLAEEQANEQAAGIRPIDEELADAEAEQEAKEQAEQAEKPAEPKPKPKPKPEPKPEPEQKPAETETRQAEPEQKAPEPEPKAAEPEQESVKVAAGQTRRAGKNPKSKQTFEVLYDDKSVVASQSPNKDGIAHKEEYGVDDTGVYLDSSYSTDGGDYGNNVRYYLDTDGSFSLETGSDDAGPDAKPPFQPSDDEQRRQLFEYLGEIETAGQAGDSERTKLYEGKVRSLVTAERQPEQSPTPLPAPTGRKATVTAPGGRKVDTQFALVEADQLVTSHDYGGRANPAFPQSLQPRDRSRAGSSAHLDTLYGSFDPELLGDNPLSTDGAPIVGPDGVVESGNGRVNVLRERVLTGDKRAKYTDWLADNAESFGLTADQVRSLKNPVLVRQRTAGLSDADRVAFTQESNDDTKQALSEVEQAVNDAGTLDDAFMALYNPPQNGNVLAEQNQPFVRKFLQAIPSGERSRYVTADGKQNRQLSDRIQAAVFQRAYGNEDILSLFMEEADPDIKNVLNALGRAAPIMARVRAKDPTFAGTYIPETVVESIRLIQDARKRDMKAADLIDQADFFDSPYSQAAQAIALFIETNLRSAKRMADGFVTLADTIEQDIADRATADMLGPRDPIGIEQAIDRTNQRLTDRYGDETQIQSDLLTRKPAVDDADDQGAGADDQRGEQVEAEGAETEDAGPQPDQPGLDREEWDAWVDELEDEEVTRLWKRAGYLPKARTVEAKRQVIRETGFTDQEYVIGVYGLLVDEGAFSDLHISDNQFEADADWDMPVQNFPEPARTVNAAKDAGENYISESDARAIRETWEQEADRMAREEDHSNEVIISLFDASGVVSEPWRRAGYTVLQYDIKLGDDLIEQFPMGDINDVLQSGKKVVGLIAQPPCTCFSSSGARWWQQRHDRHDREMVERMFGYKADKYFSKPKEYTRALVSMVDLAIGETSPDFFVVENPVGRIASETGLPKPTMTMEPHVYGEPYTKKTLLWGKFNTDLPTANVEPTGGSLMHKLWSSAEKDGGLRSLTPEGFAWSLFMANKTSAEQAREVNDNLQERAAESVEIHEERRLETRVALAIPHVNQLESVHGPELFKQHRWKKTTRYLTAHKRIHAGEKSRETTARVSVSRMLDIIQEQRDLGHDDLVAINEIKVGTMPRDRLLAVEREFRPLEQEAAEQQRETLRKITEGLAPKFDNPAGKKEKLNDASIESLIAAAERSKAKRQGDVDADQAPAQTETETREDRDGELEGAGATALEAAPAEAVSEPATERQPRERADDSGRENGQGNVGPDRERVSGVRSLADGEGEVPVPAGGTDERGSAAGSASSARSDAGRPALEPYQITDADELGVGTKSDKFRDNIAAIRLLKQLQAEGRQATADEQAILVRYVGWGGIPQAFFKPDGSTTKGWESRAAELKALLTEDEYDAARASTQNAHYTSAKVIGAIYEAVRRMGFDSGRILEPSVGTGNFIGLMPHSMANESAITGVELDALTSEIAGHLYPSMRLHKATGFQDYQVSNDYFDLVIGNPPFGSTPIQDASRKDISGWSVHNYFFGKSLQVTRPGGLMAMVVSSNLMDKAVGKQREWIAEQADLVGAIRLPNNAFKENALTEVTTDVLFFRKRLPGESPNGIAWTGTRTVETANGDQVKVNEYFADHPENMLGELGLFGTMYRPNEPAVVARDGQDTAALLSEAVGRLPEHVFSKAAPVVQATEELAHHSVHTELPIGSYLIEGGEIMRRTPDYGEDQAAEPVELGKKPAARVRDMLPVRDTLMSLLEAEVTGASDAQLEAARGKLNRAYDKFVAKHGYLSQLGNVQAFGDDPSYALLTSLELDYRPAITKAVADKTGQTPRKASAKKADVFSRRVLHPTVVPDSAQSAEDALSISLSVVGRVDMGYMEQLTGRDEADLVADLGDSVFRDPEHGYVTRDAYLSGNVKAKLAAAIRAAGQDKAFQRNVDALHAVQPKDINPVDIHIKPTSAWLPKEHVVAFATHILGERANPELTYIEALNRYELRLRGPIDPEHKLRWGTTDLTPAKILEAMLRHQSPVVRRKVDPDSAPVVDRAATQVAINKADEILREFNNWIWQDDERAESVGRLYNDTFNTDVEREYDGSHLTFAGKVPDSIIELRKHQRNAVWRILQSGTTLLDHVVGAGKTFTMVAAAMEMRRTGLAKKPMFAVPNHLVGQWAADFAKLYPGARILAAEPKVFSNKKKRRRLFSQIATGDWDAVIIAHSSLVRLPVDPAFAQEFLRDEVRKLMRSIDQLKAEKGDKRTIKQIEAQRDRLKARIQKMIDANQGDDVLDMSRLGIDALFLDEAHEFKNLNYASGMGRIGGLGDPSGSAKASDLYIKIRSILDRTGGRNVVFATGTPISNSVVEMYHMQRYLAHDQLEAKNLTHFDAWADQFGQVVTDYELDVAGNYKQKARLSKYVNLPELSSLYRSFADVVNNEMIRKTLEEQGKRSMIPPMRTGKQINVLSQPSEAQQEFTQQLIHRSEHLPPDKSEDNMLKIMGEGRLAALDMRIIDPTLPDHPDSKVSKAAEKVLAEYQQWNEDRGTQLIFCDMSVPNGARSREARRIKELVSAAEQGDDAAATELEKYSQGEILALTSEFSVYDALRDKLIEGGIPADEVAFIHDADNDAKKTELFAKVNSGKVRVLLGSSSKMGAGMNVQERIVALHHLDVPWRPADLEQRNGRGLRQGNSLYLADPDNFALAIYNYATEETMDARQWQLIETKARFIEQSRQRPKEGQRVIEETGDMIGSAAEMKALASGNPLVFEELQLRDQIRKLEALEREYRMQQQAQRNNVKRQRRFLESAPARRQTIADLIAQRDAARKQRGDDFKMKVGARSYSKRNNAGEAISSIVGAALDPKLPKSLREPVSIATMDGLDFTAELQGGGKALDVVIYPDATDDIAPTYIPYEDFTGRGAVTRIENMLGRLDEALVTLDVRVQDAAEQVEAIEQHESTGFGQAAELDELRARHREILEKLAGTEDKPVDDAPPAEAAVEGEVVNDEAPEPAPSVATPEQQEQTQREDAAAVLSAGQFAHTKTGEIQYVASMGQRVERSEYQRLAALAKVHKGRYSSYRGGDAIPGFLFKSEEDRDAFMAAADERPTFSLKRDGGTPLLRPGTYGADRNPENLARLDKAAAEIEKHWGTRPNFEAVRLHRDRNTRKARRVRRAVKTLFGKRVQFYRLEGDGAQAFYSRAVPDTIFVNVEATAPLREIVGHEMLHALRRHDSGLYNEIVDSLSGFLQNYGSYADELLGQYRRDGYPTPPELLQDEEFIADTFGAMFAQPGFLAELEGSMQPRLFIRLINKAMAFLDRLVAKFRSPGNRFADRYIKDLESVRQIVLDGLRKHAATLPINSTLHEAAREAADTARNSPPRFMRRTQPIDFPSRWTLPEESLWGAAVRNMQNYFLRVKQIQEQIKASGGEVTEEMDVELAERNYMGSAANDLRHIQQSYVKPVTELLIQNGIGLEEFDAYLYAKHAEERNNHIWEINPEFREFEIPGSGMSNEQAAEVLAAFDEDGKTPALEQAAALIHNMNEERLDTLVEYGLEEEENIATWRDRYEFYVPLKGQYDGRHIQRIRPGRGFESGGRNIIAAFGRRSRADSPFLNAVLQAQEAAIRGRKAVVGQRLYRLMGEHENPNVFRLWNSEGRVKAQWDATRGEVVYKHDTRLPDDVIKVKVGGKIQYIQLVDPLLMRAFLRLHSDEISPIERGLLKVNRYLSTINTSLNPEFLVSNVARDFQTALHAMAAHTDVGELQGMKIGAISKQMLASMPKALKSIYSLLEREEAGAARPQGAWEKLFYRYREAGAMTGFYDMRDIEGLRSEVKGLIAEAEGGNIAKARVLFRKGKALVSNLNSAAENATRLVAFKIATDAGLSDAQAAGLARNLTVNFNRRGELGTAMNAMYLFYNAGIQGTAQMVKVMRSPFVQKIAGATALFAFTLAMLNQAAAGEDDDGENYYDLLPNSILERNMVISLGGNRWVTIPLPYGYNIFHVLGTQAARVMQGKDISEASLAVMRAAATSFIPVATDSSQEASSFFIKLLSPTIADPLVELSLNENAFGAPIYRTKSPFGGNKTPDSQLHMRNTGAMVRAFAETLNDLSGGSEVRSGAIDLSPDSIEHLISFATGGAGLFISRTGKVIGKAATGDLENLEIKDVPFARRVLATTPEWAATQRYYEAVEKVEAADDERRNQLRKPVGEREALPDDLQKALPLRGRLKQVNSRLNVLYRRRKKVLANTRYTQAEKDEKVEAINDEISRLQKQFGLAYEKAS